MRFQRTFDILEHINKNFQKDDFLVGKIKGDWKKFSTKEYYSIANNISSGLLELGLKKGDKIATVSSNRPEWNLFDMGMSQIGVIHVPVYPTISEEEYLHILSHSDASILLVSTKILYNKVVDITKKINSIKHIYTFDEIEGVKNWEEIEQLGNESFEKNKTKIKDIKDSIKTEDLCSIIYTSGTTGLSKGVMLSHQNFMSNLEGVFDRITINEHDRALSFLPLCHVYERIVNYTVQAKGLSVYYAENMGTIANDIVRFKVSIFTTVPRLLETVYDKILTKGKDLTGIKKTLFFWALDLGFRYEHENRNFLYNIQHKIATKLVFSKWRTALGGNIKTIVSGGAALQPRLARVFTAAGIPVQEGYGLTETAPVISFNDVNKHNEAMFGSVGPILDNVNVKIAEDGEILVKGPNIMLGYYKDEVQTKEVFDKDGWFCTGDIGELVDGKFLKITDRKKEIFKLSNGKYVAPTLIENKFKESIFIQQVFVVGVDEKFASALISPNFDHLHFWASKHNIHYNDNKTLVNSPKVIKKYQEEVTEANKSLAQHEQIKRFKLVCDEWTPQTGELSPTLKKKRKVLYGKYDHLLREIYQYSEGQENVATNKK